MDPALLKKLILIREATPKEDAQTLFVGRNDGQFTGNVKYLFLHFVKHAPELNPLYLTFNRDTHLDLEAAGLPVALFPNENALLGAARAKTVIVDDFHFKNSPVNLLLSGASIIQLWHGVGFKKIGFLEADSKLDLSKERRQELRQLYSGYDAVISTSPFYTKNLFSTSFGTREIWETGYPRNDVFFRPPTKHDLLQADPQLYGQIKKLGKKKTVALYVPTFRDTGGTFFAPQNFDLAQMDTFLERINSVLVIKMHSFSGTPKIKGARNIFLFPCDKDIYPLMPITDYMITDYSSIYTDYLTMNKPVLFYPYDWDEYTSKNRELQFDYDWITPGPKLKNQNELLMAMKLLSENKDDGYGEQRREIGQLAFANHDGQSSERILTRIKAQLSA